MRCACGQPGTIELKRRELPYCTSCFEHMLVRAARAEIGDGALRLVPATKENQPWHAAATQLASAARREVVLDENGCVPGCAEIAATHAIQFLFQDAPGEALVHVFPRTIRKEELQLFYTPLTEIPLSDEARELMNLETVHPGTIASVLRSAEERTQ
jgi:hypothetical protein